MNLVSTSLQGNLQRSRRCGAQPDAAHIGTQAGPRTRQVPALFLCLSLSLCLLLCSAVVWINKSRLDSRLIAACKSSANASAIKTTCFCAFQLVAESLSRSVALSRLADRNYAIACRPSPSIGPKCRRCITFRYDARRRDRSGLRGSPSRTRGDLGQTPWPPSKDYQC